MSCNRGTPFQRRCGRLVIDDSSSSSSSENGSDSSIENDDETNWIEPSTYNRVKQRQATPSKRSNIIIEDNGDGDSLLSDSDGSLENLMTSLRIDNNKEKDEKRSNEGSKQNPSKVSSSVDDSTQTKIEDEGNIKSDDESLMDSNSAWARSRRHKNEYYLSPEKNADVKWPSLRIPSVLFRRLYGYQKVGVQWMASLHENKIGGILGDDMGMGKTYMTLTYLGGLMRAGTIKNALIVAPLSVLRSWEKEANNVLAACVPNVRVKVLSSEVGKNTRSKILTEALACRSKEQYLMIATYGLVRSATSEFTQYGEFYWNYVVLDEGHQIKNSKAETSWSCRAICNNPRTRRIMVTGTPILNNLTELWSLFDWSTSGQVLGDLRSFTKNVSKPIEAARDKYASEGDVQLGARVNTELQMRIKPYFLQRKKIDFLADKLPSKTELVVWTHLSSIQRSKYAKYVDSGFVKNILTGELGSPLEAITWLKKLCGHPSLAINKQEGSSSHERQDSDSRDEEQQSGKLEVLVSLMNLFRKNGHRALIFSQSTRMLNIIEDTLQGVNLSRIDGSTREKERQRLVDDFNSGTGSVDAMLLTTKAAGIGLTLVGADRVVVYDPSWTPAEDAQAVDRCYRIGQTKPVQVFRLITAGTVEEKMYEKQVHKDGIRRTVLSEGVSVQRYFDRSELRRLFTLSSPGVCEVMEKVHEESQGVQTDWNQHKHLLNHHRVVGLSRHDGFYKQPPKSETQNGWSTTFGGERVKKLTTVRGKSQRVLQSNNNNYPVPLGGKKSREKVMGVLEKKACSKIQVESNEARSIKLKENNMKGKSAVLTPTEVIDIDAEENENATSVFERSDQLQARGKINKSARLLLDLIEDRDRYNRMGKKEKIELHKRLAKMAGSLKLFKRS